MLVEAAVAELLEVLAVLAAVQKAVLVLE